MSRGPGVHLVKYPSRLGVAALAYRGLDHVGAVADIRGDGIAIGI